jgi:hypothetical protein
MHKRALLCLIGLLTGVAMSACGAEPTHSTSGQPSWAPVTAGPTPTATGSPDSQFGDIDKATAGFLTRDADWQVPPALDVDKTTRIGLSIGSGPTVTSGIQRLLPSTSPTPAGPIEIGPTVGVTLRADPDDAVITPSEMVNASTGTDVEMLFTWFVHPLHPNSALLLTAYIELPLADGHVIMNAYPLTLEVRRTLPYTLHQIFTNWATWSSIAGAVAGVVAWLYRRRRKRLRAARTAAAAAQAVAPAA